MDAADEEMMRQAELLMKKKKRHPKRSLIAGKSGKEVSFHPVFPPLQNHFSNDSNPVLEKRLRLS